MESIYISGHLKNTDRGKHIAKFFVENFSKEKNNIKVKVIPDNLHSRNEWCRDYMPVKAADGSLVLFKYMPSYMQDRKDYRAMIPDQKAICDHLKLDVVESDIILDGGAIEICGDKGIISDRVLTENTTCWNNATPEIILEIKKLLKLKELIVVPSDPWDFTGHVDGMVRFVSEKQVFINDYSGSADFINSDSDYNKLKFIRWYNNLMDSIGKAGLNIAIFPCHSHINENDDWAIGVYLNYLQLNNYIIIPGFGDHPNNFQAKGIISLYFRDKEVIQVEATELAKRGGIINCVTWAI